MLLLALVALPVAILPATVDPLPENPAPAAAYDCAFDYASQDWDGPTAVRVALDFAQQRATVTAADGTRTWTYERKPGYRVAVVTTEGGGAGATGEGAEGFFDLLMFDANNTLTWLQFTPQTESSTVWTCTPG